MAQLFVIVIAELFGVSLWFSANSVADNISAAWKIGPAGIGVLTSAVQFGFIIGTLVISLSGLADRFAASRIFALSCLVGGISNAAFAFLGHGIFDGSFWRFITGICLAGIYPLGMKLVVSWSSDKRESTLGWLVGMLTLGTATPHFLKYYGAAWDWQSVILVTTVLAWIAGVFVFAVGDGQHLTRAKNKSGFAVGVISAFKQKDFCSSALGYFGHMWELYAFWAITPLLVNAVYKGPIAKVSLISFLVIGIGSIGCVLGGVASRRFGSARIAALSLIISALVCLVYPLASQLSSQLALVCLFIWGLSVVPDSPQFSALSAAAAPITGVGSSLAIQNSIGFAITMVSISLVTSSWLSIGPYVAWLLLPGPVFGLYGMRQLLKPR